ncbi:hypothetical protein [Streptomyces mirabilis]|uniref:hypothetical protein n=1 Tax=Streptomyces mirabilis TaxID=68239 RepID=UPI0036CB278F
MRASDFSERAVQGLRPDLAMVAVPSSTATHHYVPRLLRALGGHGVRRGHAPSPPDLLTSADRDDAMDAG